MRARGHLVGRESERELVGSVLRNSAGGSPGALLLAGEPGVGKTSLVAEVTSGADAAGHLVLWGRCLRFGADSSPYLPIGQLLTQWHRQADASERARVLAGAEQLASVVPTLGGVTGPVETTRLLPLLAAVLDRIATSAPLVLVLDDLHWADGTSLDLLAFLMAGFDDGQRLSVMVTYRDTELGEGHRLHGWLADVMRLPAVSRLHLDRLGFAEAEELVARLGDGVTSRDLAAQVFEKAAGNPYYTELLVHDAGDGTAPGKEEGLQRAILSQWHRLGSRARELLQVLAVGGRPVAVEVLERLVTARGRTPDDVTSALTEATEAGLTTVGTEGWAWFHHPLVAEVVAASLTHAAMRALHLEYVAVIESSAELTASSRAAHLALHHHGAGHLAEAFTWSLTAADEATAVRGYAEEFDHLHRACRLWDQVADGRSVEERIRLWQRAAASAWSAGEHALAVGLLQETIALAEAAEDWSRVVWLRARLWRRRIFGGLEFLQDPGFMAETLELAASRCPGTVEHALAMAQSAFAERWNANPEARMHATAALQLARRTGSDLALAWTLGVNSQVEAAMSPGLADAQQSLELARGLNDAELLGNAAVWTANCLLDQGRVAEAGETLVATFNELVAHGSVQDALWAQPEFGALLLINLGRWSEASALLRELLSRRLPSDAAADVRSVAALLAFRTGDVESGRTHLERARELRPARRAPGELLPFMEAEGLWACGQPREALAHVTALMGEQAQLDTDGAGELLVLAAHAAADLAEIPGGRPEAVALLERVEELRGTASPWFAQAAPVDLTHPARERLFLAERARCHGTANVPALLRSAAEACQAAGSVWEEAVARYQLARALLGVTGSRTEAAASLRRAARIAEDLGAAPVLADVRATAAQARIPLDDPVVPSEADENGLLALLTPREREVLSHVVAGRTYMEVAAALFISEKTVSVHVSNLLRKTGTSSRVELADLARRTG